MKKYKRCIECDKIIAKTKKSQNDFLCTMCKKSKLFQSKIVSKITEDECLFEDDPRALTEIEYGRVVKNPTHVFSRTSLDDFG
jgi:hypothetical protein